MPDPDIVLYGNPWPTSNLTSYLPSVMHLGAHCVRCKRYELFVGTAWFVPIALRSSRVADELTHEAGSCLYAPPPDLLEESHFNLLLQLPEAAEGAEEFLGEAGFPVRFIVACAECADCLEVIAPDDTALRKTSRLIAALRERALPQLAS